MTRRRRLLCDHAKRRGEGLVYRGKCLKSVRKRYTVKKRTDGGQRTEDKREDEKFFLVKIRAEIREN